MQDSLEVIVKRLVEKNTDSINLSDRNLTEIPYEITKLTNIKQLYMDRNKLIFVPEIGNFVKLKELSLEENQLSLIPETFHNLKLLERLNLSKNDIKCLNSNLFTSLRNLNILWLNSCGLMYLPKEIGCLEHLERLGVRSNCLQDIPEEIGKLSKLKWLNLERNEIERLPETLKDLHSLNYLNVSFNKLDEIPALFFQMRNLNTLIINDNKIRSFKDDHVLGFSSFNKIDIRNNPFLKDPNKSQMLKELQSIKNFIVQD